MCNVTWNELNITVEHPKSNYDKIRLSGFESSQILLTAVRNTSSECRTHILFKLLKTVADAA